MAVVKRRADGVNSPKFSRRPRFFAIGAYRGFLFAPAMSIISLAPISLKVKEEVSFEWIRTRRRYIRLGMS